MSEKPSKDDIILTAGVGQRLAKDDGGDLARVVSARIVEEKRLAAIEAAKAAQKTGSEQVSTPKVLKPVSRNQRRKEARNLRKLASSSEAERKELVRLIHVKAEEMGLPFQVLVQRMMDSDKANLVEMAKIIRGIK
jgi:hypothetical protein